MLLSCLRCYILLKEANKYSIFHHFFSFWSVYCSTFGSGVHGDWPRYKQCWCRYWMTHQYCVSMCPLLALAKPCYVVFCISQPYVFWLLSICIVTSYAHDYMIVKRLKKQKGVEPLLTHCSILLFPFLLAGFVVIEVVQ